MIKKNVQYILIIILSALIITGCTAGQGTALINDGIISGSVKINENLILTDSQLPDLVLNKTITVNSYKLQTLSVDHSQLIIRLTKKTTPMQLKLKVLKNRGHVIKKIGDYTYKVKLTSGENSNTISMLRGSPLVSYIEYDYPLYIQNIPDDPYYPQQWNLNMLGMEKVWDKYTGDKDVVVAVIDTGILPDHPDLKDNITAGYDFVDNDNDPTDTSMYFSHGTHVAGIIGAVSNNTRGVSGINWQVKIMPVRVIGPEGNGGYSNLIEGINWAAENGAQIINLSLAGSFYSESLRNAIKNAVDRGITVVASAGNNGSTPILYPAKYPEVISVGAVGPEAEIAYYSNYGPDLDLVAPGGNSNNNSFNYNTILSTAGHLNSQQQPVHQYNWAEGTSMAAPHVAGAIALLYSSGINVPEDVKKRLTQTAVDLGPGGIDDKYGAGLLNIKGALNIIDNNDPDDLITFDNDGKKDLNKIKVFTAYQNTDTIKQSSTISHPDDNGLFHINIKEGKWTLIAWLDTDNSDNINAGDYYGKRENIIVKPGQTTSGLDITLGKLSGP